jgi:hypothetical protein
MREARRAGATYQSIADDAGVRLNTAVQAVEGFTHKRVPGAVAKRVKRVMQPAPSEVRIECVDCGKVRWVHPSNTAVRCMSCLRKAQWAKKLEAKGNDDA